MNGCLCKDPIYGCLNCGDEHCDLAGQDYPSSNEINKRLNNVAPKQDKKTYTCKYCGTPNLIWQETPTGWRLYDKYGAVHSCERPPHEICDIYDAIRFLQECVYLSKPVFKSDGGIIDFIDESSVSIDIGVIKINPKINQVDDIASLNTQNQIWGECGYYSLSNKCWSHDIQFDCGGDTLDSIYISLAKKISSKYPYIRKDFSIKEISKLLEEIEKEGDESCEPGWLEW